MKKVIKYQSDENGYSVLIKDRNIQVWVDVWIDETYSDVFTEWNQYIFDTKNTDDVKAMRYQEKVDNYAECSSLAVEYLQAKGVIYQDKNGMWFKALSTR